MSNVDNAKCWPKLKGLILIYNTLITCQITNKQTNQTLTALPDLISKVHLVFF